jgi:ribosomal-protein-serine acetyltransferase
VSRRTGREAKADETTGDELCRIELADDRWLRPLEESDAQALYEVIKADRDRLARWMPWAAGQTFEDTLAFIQRTREQLANNNGFQTAVIVDGHLVGMVGFHGVSWDHRSTSIGYWLAESAQGRGTMTRAVQALIEHAFMVWRLHRVEIRAAVDNARSRAVPERLGFIQEGVAREAERIGDRYIDQVVYSMLATGMSPSDRRRAAAEDLARAGGRDVPVEIIDYDPAWPAAFETERERLAPLLEGAEIHHFGSTAVPGLAAKPVIDMIVLVGDLDAPIAALVESAGYQFPRAYNATLAHRRFLCYPTAAHRTHHLHLVDDREEFDRRLRFRDRLRADPALARGYATLKHALAERYRDDREAYTDAKAAFVKHWSKPDATVEHSD